MFQFAFGFISAALCLVQSHVVLASSSIPPHATQSVAQEKVPGFESLAGFLALSDADIDANWEKYDGSAISALDLGSYITAVENHVDRRSLNMDKGGVEDAEKQIHLRLLRHYWRILFSGGDRFHLWKAYWEKSTPIVVRMMFHFVQIESKRNRDSLKLVLTQWFVSFLEHDYDWLGRTDSIFLARENPEILDGLRRDYQAAFTPKTEILAYRVLGALHATSGSHYEESGLTYLPARWLVYGHSFCKFKALSSLAPYDPSLAKRYLGLASDGSDSVSSAILFYLYSGSSFPDLHLPKEDRDFTRAFQYLDRASEKEMGFKFDEHFVRVMFGGLSQIEIKTLKENLNNRPRIASVNVRLLKEDLVSSKEFFNLVKGRIHQYWRSDDVALNRWNETRQIIAHELGKSDPRLGSAYLESWAKEPDAVLPHWILGTANLKSGKVSEGLENMRRVVERTQHLKRPVSQKDPIKSTSVVLARNSAIMHLAIHSCLENGNLQRCEEDLGLLDGDLAGQLVSLVRQNQEFLANRGFRSILKAYLIEVESGGLDHYHLFKVNSGHTEDYNAREIFFLQFSWIDLGEFLVKEREKLERESQQRIDPLILRYFTILHDHTMPRVHQPEDQGRWPVATNGTCELYMLLALAQIDAGNPQAAVLTATKSNCNSRIRKAEEWVILLGKRLIELNYFNDAEYLVDQILNVRRNDHRRSAAAEKLILEIGRLRKSAKDTRAALPLPVLSSGAAAASAGGAPAPLAPILNPVLLKWLKGAEESTVRARILGLNSKYQSGLGVLQRGLARSGPTSADVPLHTTAHEVKLRFRPLASLARIEKETELYRFPVGLQKKDASTLAIEGQFISEFDSLPSSSDQLTLILGGRGLDAQVPEGSRTSRAVLIITDDQILSGLRQLNLGQSPILSLRQALVALGFARKGLDIFVVRKLNYHGTDLTQSQMNWISPRRLAALYLAFFLDKLDGKRIYFSMVDDNIQEIAVSRDLPMPATFLSWPEFYAFFSHFLSQRSEISIVGLKEKQRWSHGSANKILFQKVGVKEKVSLEKLLSGLSDESGQNPQDAETSLGFEKVAHSYLNSGFGQKIFFFDWHKIRAKLAGARLSVEDLLPVSPRLSQEDLYLQLVTEGAVYIKKSSIHFVRNQKSGRMASQFFKEEKIQSTDWMGLPTETLTETAKKIQGLIRTALDTYKTEFERISNRSLAQLHVQPLVAGAAAAQPFHELSVSPGMEEAAGTEKGRDPAKRGLKETFDRLTFDPPTNWDKLEAELSSEIVTSAVGAKIEKPLRGHQQIALSALKGALKAGQLWGYFNMATGTGKSRIIAAISDAAVRAFPEKNVYIISPRIQLTSQMGVVLGETVDIGTGMNSASVAAHNKADFKGGKRFSFVNVSFEEFCANRSQLQEMNLKDVAVIIVDEAHRLPPQTIRIIEKAKASGVLVLGFTATPSSTTIKIFQNEIHAYGRDQAVADGILVAWETHLVPLKSESEDQFIEEVSDEVFKATPHQNKIVVYIDSLKSGTQMADRLAVQLNRKDNQIVAGSYHSLVADALNQNSRSLRLFSNLASPFRVLVAVEMLREGFDMPCLAHAFIASFMPRVDQALSAEKLIASEQILGRILRKCESNPELQKDMGHFYVSDSRISELLPSYSSEASGAAQPTRGVRKRSFLETSSSSRSPDKTQ